MFYQLGYLCSFHAKSIRIAIYNKNINHLFIKHFFSCLYNFINDIKNFYDMVHYKISENYYKWCIFMYNFRSHKSLSKVTKTANYSNSQKVQHVNCILVRRSIMVFENLSRKFMSLGVSESNELSRTSARHLFIFRISSNFRKGFSRSFFRTALR